MEGSMRPATFRPAEAQRMDAFVDAAFAFAVSLLIIAGAEPLRTFDDLAEALGRIPAFAAGFALIAMFWLAHRTWSVLTPERNAWTTFLSLAVVFAVLVFVFPLRLLTETATHFLSGRVLPGGDLLSSFDDLRWMYVIYGAAFAVLSTLHLLLFVQARRALTGIDDVARTSAMQWERTWSVAAASGVVSALIASTPLLPAAPWLPGAAYNLIPLGVFVMMLLDRRRRRAASQGQGGADLAPVDEFEVLRAAPGCCTRSPRARPSEAGERIGTEGPGGNVRPLFI